MTAQQFDPVYFSLIGFLIVFITLFALVLMVSFIKWIDKRWEERETMQKEAALNKPQNIDNTTLILISAAIGAYFQGRARIRRVRVLPHMAKQGGSWAFQARANLQGSHFLKK